MTILQQESRQEYGSLTGTLSHICKKTMTTHTHPFNGPMSGTTRVSWYTHRRLTTLCLGLPGWAGTRKVKPIWILLKQETVRGSGIGWAICKSAPRSRQTTTPAPHPSVFTGQMPFLPPNQQRQSTEGNDNTSKHEIKTPLSLWTV